MVALILTLVWGIGVVGVSQLRQKSDDATRATATHATAEGTSDALATASAAASSAVYPAVPQLALPATTVSPPATAPPPGAERNASASSVAIATSSTAATVGGQACAENEGQYGAMKVCPGAGPVGSRVTITAIGCKYLWMVIFLGPGSYIGANGAGGTSVKVTPNTDGDFTVAITIPASYTTGGPVQRREPVLPGWYQIGSYPANVCSAPFRVTSGKN